MRRFLSLARVLLLLLLLACAFCLCLTEQQTPEALAAPQALRVPSLRARVEGRVHGQTHKANAKTSTTEALPEVREVDLEALQKLLQRAPGKDARPLLINFWATWCEPCREEFPDLVRIKTDYEKRDLDFITISLDDPAELKTSVPEFLREMRARMPAYLLNVIEPQSVMDLIDPEWRGGLPATFLFDASGKIIFKHTGRVNAQELRAAIDKVTTAK